jgi:hypothetical protein
LAKTGNPLIERTRRTHEGSGSAARHVVGMELNALTLGLAAVTSAALAWRWRGDVRTWDWTDRVGAALLVPAIATFWLLVVTTIAAAPSADWNAARLTNTFALVYGYQLFYPASEGPILSSVYGPVGAWAFLPATLFRTPTAAVLAGATLQIAFVYGAMLVVVWHAGAGGRRGPLTLAAGLGACLLMARYDGPYAWLARTHPDGVALALGLLACAPLARPDGAPPSSRAQLASATAAVLACWAKQIAAPLPFALVLAVWLAHGRHVAVQYAVRMGLVGAVVSIAMLAAFGSPMIFNMFILMQSQPWYRHDLAGIAAYVWGLARGVWGLGVLLAVGLAARLGLTPGRPLAASGCVAPLIAAALLLPTGALGSAKVGGEVTSFHSLYYLIAAVAILLVEAGLAARRRRLLTYAFLALAMFGAWRSPHFAIRGPRPSVWENNQQRAYEFAIRHPGEAYFPWQPLASLLAEGRLYPFEYAVFDRYLAGYEPSPEHLRANLPPRVRWIAAPTKPWIIPSFPEFSEETTLPELPGWYVRARPAP